MCNYFDINYKYKLLHVESRCSHMVNMMQYKDLGYQMIVNDIYVSVCVFSHK